MGSNEIDTMKLVVEMKITSNYHSKWMWMASEPTNKKGGEHGIFIKINSSTDIVVSSITQRVQFIYFMILFLRQK